jgi:hypothetical protein
VRDTVFIHHAAMAKISEYDLLKEHIYEVELSMQNRVKWFATKLSTKKFPVLDDNMARHMKNPLSVLQPHDKATQMFERLLDWVSLNPSGLDEFVKILKVEPVEFKVLIQKLDKSKFTMSYPCMITKSAELYTSFSKAHTCIHCESMHAPMMLLYSSDSFSACTLHLVWGRCAVCVH